VLFCESTSIDIDSSPSTEGKSLVGIPEEGEVGEGCRCCVSVEGLRLDVATGDEFADVEGERPDLARSFLA
jgi:hypothetical protein